MLNMGLPAIGDGGFTGGKGLSGVTSKVNQFASKKCVANMLCTSNFHNREPCLLGRWGCPHWKPCTSASGIAITPPSVPNLKVWCQAFWEELWKP